MTSLHCMQCITSLCNASSLIDNYHDDHGMMMARRVSADWAHKCWAPVLAAAAAVSGPDTRSSGKYDAKLSTQPRGERREPEASSWWVEPRARWQGSEKTIRRPWESTVTESQTISVATGNYFIRRHQNSCDGSELLPGDLQKCCVTRTGDNNIRAWPQHRLATVGHRLSIA